jgi:hypothetical protein
LKKRNKFSRIRFNMKLTLTIICVLLSLLIANIEALKVIYARNATAFAIKADEAERLAKERESRPNEGTIINVPQSCKPGFVYEGTFHNRCRKIAG